MSFRFTIDQVKDRSKTVTRRKGWSFLKPGEILNACEKCMGLKKGERIKRLVQIRIIDIRKERLDAITQDDCTREGFSAMTPAEFVAMFCKNNQCKTNTVIYRIEYEYIEEAG